MSMIAVVLLTCTVACCDGFGYSEYQKEDPKAVVETTKATESSQHTQSVESVWQSVESVESVGFKVYTIHGVTPSEDLQRELYRKLEERGIAWFMPYAVAQIWQESRWNPKSTNGRDHGLTQQKGIYWDGRASAYGIPGADIWDAHAQIHVYSWMMAGYLSASGGDVGRALSMYYLGADGWAQNYVDAVMGQMGGLR